MSSPESSFLHSSSPTSKNIIKNQESKNPQLFQIHYKWIIHSNIYLRLSLLQTKYFHLRNCLLLHLRLQKIKSFYHTSLSLAIRKFRVQVQNSFSSESSWFSSKKNLSALQKNSFLRPIPKIVSSHGKSAVPRDFS